MRRPYRCAVRVVAVVALIGGSPLLASLARAEVSSSGVLEPVVLAADAAPAAKSAPTKSKGKAAKAPKAPKVKTPRHAHSPEAGAWDGGALWITLRAGYNQASYRTAGNGSVGYGFGFTRMLNGAWGLSGITERNVLGQFGDATESEIPFTLELDRHVKMSDQFQLYFGAGGGVYYHKFTNTTADYSDVRSGGLLSAGGNIMVSKHSLFGLDGRMAWVSTKTPAPETNPVFGPQQSSTTRWGVKATWSVTY